MAVDFEFTDFQEIEIIGFAKRFKSDEIENSRKIERTLLATATELEKTPWGTCHHPHPTWNVTTKVGRQLGTFYLRAPE